MKIELQVAVMKFDSREVVSYVFEVTFVVIYL
jgi:hypothetical protein